MIKLLSLILLFVPCFSFSAGSQTPSPSPAAPASEGNPATTISAIAKERGLVWVLEHPKETEPPLTPQQKNLLVIALQWVDENLKFERIDEDHSTFGAKGANYKPDLEKCSDLDLVQFGSFDGAGPLELLLGVSGGFESGAHGYNYTDEKYVFCHCSKKGFSAKVLEEDKQWTAVERVKRPHGPDLLWIGEGWFNPMFDHDPGKANLYQEVDGEMKKVLTYEYILTEWQRPDGFGTRLLPDEKGNIHLLKYTRDSTHGDMNHFKETYTETIFKWSPFWKEYKKDGDEKPASKEEWDKKSDYGTGKSIF